MTYVNPEIRLVGTAVSVIGGQPPGSKIGVIPAEVGPPPNWVTAAAYQADE